MTNIHKILEDNKHFTGLMIGIAVLAYLTTVVIVDITRDTVKIEAVISIYIYFMMLLSTISVIKSALDMRKANKAQKSSHNDQFTHMCVDHNTGKDDIVTARIVEGKLCPICKMPNPHYSQV